MALSYQGQAINLDDLNRILAASPTYQAALRGQWWAPGTPEYAKNDRFKAMNLREAARVDGVIIPGGYIDSKTGKVSDPNADHWYSDPRILGPVAVATAATLGILTAPTVAATSGGTSALSSIAPTAAELGKVSAIEHATTLSVPSLTGTTSSSLARTLLNYGLPIAGNLASSIIQSKAISAAQKAEQAYLDKALAQEKQEQEYQRARNAGNEAYDRAKYDDSTNYDRARYDEGETYRRKTYADYLTTLEPYRQAGTAASDRMAGILGLNITPNSGTTYPQLAQQAGTPVTLAQQFPSNLSSRFLPVAGPPTGSVKMQAPNGEVMDVPNNLVSHYTELGAVRV